MVAVGTFYFVFQQAVELLPVINAGEAVRNGHNSYLFFGLDALSNIQKYSSPDNRAVRFLLRCGAALDPANGAIIMSDAELCMVMRQVLCRYLGFTLDIGGILRKNAGHDVVLVCTG